MEERYLQVGGDDIRADDLTNPKARDLAVRLRALGIPLATFVECRRQGQEETVVLDVRVEVPNRRVHQIHRRERIAATFYEGDGREPRVEALREDFPVVPHLNLHLQEKPRSLCLYEEPYGELKRRWTSARFVHRIREWMELNAKGELHQNNQDLEPILVDFAGHIVLPPDIEEKGNGPLFVSGIIPDDGSKWFLRVHRQDPRGEGDTPPVVVSVHACQPMKHGAIHRCPGTLKDVVSLAQSAGLDLLGELREALPTWIKNCPDFRVILVVSFPKTRVDGGHVERPDTWCFATVQSVRQIGLCLGLWEDVDGSLGTLMEIDQMKQGQDVPVVVLNPSYELARDRAAQLNGMVGASDTRCVGVGVGALGSQVVMNFARAGFGRWTLIDHDRLMPHNLARHALGGGFVGFNKAEAVAFSAGTTTWEGDVFVGLDSELQANGETIKEVLSDADVVVDMTASVTAQRYLARDLNSSARQLCTFLSPSGADLVILAEDGDHQVTLDALEMQYYRALLNEPGLAGHLESEGDRQRYARSCGDMTSAMPQHLVALHSAIASKSLREIIEGGTAFVGVWRVDADLNVRHISIDTRHVTEYGLGAWAVVLDDGVRDKLSRLREGKLPNETGGVLLGSCDMERRILYIVDTLPSPSDSEERTDAYIRGCKGLQREVKAVEKKTAGMLEYIGEWHSHPRGASTRPSDYDLVAFDWLIALRSGDGLPAVMIIVGDVELSLFVDTMGAEASPIPGGINGEMA